MREHLLYFCKYEQERGLFSPLMCSFSGNIEALEFQIPLWFPEDMRIDKEINKTNKLTKPQTPKNNMDKELKKKAFSVSYL